jgi:hypothetical protein
MREGDATKAAKTLAAATFLATAEIMLRDGTVAPETVFRISEGKGGGPIIVAPAAVGTGVLVAVGLRADRAETVQEADQRLLSVAVRTKSSAPWSVALASSSDT